MSTAIPTLKLPEPSFIDRDPNQVVSDMTLQWETLTSKTLYPAQVEYLQMNLTAYREILMRIGIQEAAKQNLVSYARYPMLDYLGELVGCYRMLPQYAKSVVVFSHTPAPTSDFLIPQRTRIASGTLIFETDVDAVIKANTTDIAVTVTAVDPGPNHNNIPVGLLDTLVSLDLPNLTVANAVITQGGLDIESDDRFRARVKLASNQFASAGPRGAYDYYVKSVRQDIIYVGIARPVPGKVRIYPLLDSGLPDNDLLIKIFQALTDENVRPLTDEVEVVAPTSVPYTISMKVKLFQGVAQSSVIPLVEVALQEFATSISKTLGRDLVPSQWIEVAQSIPGVYSCVLNNLPQTVVSSEGTWMPCTGITVTYDGYGSD